MEKYERNQPNASCIVQFANRQAANANVSDSLLQTQSTSVGAQPLAGSSRRRHRSYENVSNGVNMPCLSKRTPHGGMSAIVSSLDSRCDPRATWKHDNMHRSRANRERAPMLATTSLRSKEAHTERGSSQESQLREANVAYCRPPLPASCPA